MTPSQIGGYWRRWKLACIEQGWTRLPRAELDAKRYAVHANCGVPSSMTKFNKTSHPDKVFKAFELLADPTSLKKVVELDAQLQDRSGERKRLIYRIEMTMPEAYVREIMRGKFDTERFDDLDLVQLDQLRLTVIERKRARDRQEKISKLTAPAIPAQTGLAFPTGHPVVEYQMRPAKTFVPAQQATSDSNPY